MYKKIVLVLAFITVLLTPSAALASFKDIPETSKYYQPIKYLEDKGIVRSYKNSRFNPDAKIKKVDFLRMIMDDSKVAISSKKNIFTGFKDISKKAWYSPYVKKALELGIIKKGNYFYPKKSVRKGDGLKMIFELKGVGIPKILDESTTFKFKDVKRTSRFAGVAKAAEKKNLFEENVFQPYKTLTRGEVAEIIYKLDTQKEADKIFEPQTITIEITSLPASNGITNQEKFPILVNVWETIMNSFLKKDQLDENELMYSAISGLVNELDDPYSTFQEPLAAGVLQTSLEGNYEGIGVMVEMIDGEFTVIAPFDNSPAEKSGMKAGDVITHIDGESVDGMSVELIVSKIKGPAGTDVKLKIKRGSDILSLTVTRGKITLEAVSGELKLPSKIGVVTITSFTQNSAQTFADTVNDLISKGARGLVIDLRNNPGGFLDAVVKMLNNYIAKDSPILSTQYGDKSTETVFSEGPGSLADIKTAVVVNGGTASASEILAGVLQDYGLAKVVGETTFGKGTVQQIVNYGDGSSLKLTIAKWMTAKGRNIEGIGITPDIVIADNEESPADEVLDAAIQEVLNEWYK